MQNPVGEKEGTAQASLAVVAFLDFLFSNLFLSFLSHVESPFSTHLALSAWGELDLGSRHDRVCDLTEQAV